MYFLSGNTISASVLQSDPLHVSFVKPSAGAIVSIDNLQNPNIPEDSIAVIPIEGLILPWQSQDIENALLNAFANPNIMSILLLMNSPGGTVSYLDILANTIKNSPKPIIAYVRGITASAAMWVASATSRILVSSQLDQLGSIGVQCSIKDYTKMLKEKFNIDVFELNATKSVNKNIEFKSLLLGNPDMIIAAMDFVNEHFHAAINANLGIPFTSEIYSGGIYYAQQAVELGLAHEIVSVQGAIEQVVKAGYADSAKKLLI